MQLAYLAQATRNLFFTGKGGVGKTSLACASALKLAERGKRVLIVSTDPASNIDEVLETELGGQATPVRGVEGLYALNIDPEQAAAAYREKVVGPYRDQLPKAVVDSMEEQLSGACTTEIAAFDAFAGLLGDEQAAAEYDHLVFDTAPTGHTLRLLSLPKAWSGFIETNTSGVSCLGPLEGLERQREVYAGAVDALADGARTVLVMVSRPEGPSLAEAARSSHELRELGIENQHLVLNGVFEATDRGDAIAVAMEQRARESLESLPDALARLPRSELPLRGLPPLGMAGLRHLLGEEAGSEAPEPQPLEAATEDFDALVSRLGAQGHGVVMAMGKGGVGKTTVAARLAVALAHQGHAVHLTTTDPAAHVEAMVDTVPGALTIGRVDPQVETERYREEVLATTGADMDEDSRRLLEEDLRSPCTEEIAVFQAFARTIAQAQDRIVVVDTAPSGHTLLLLDAAQSYHREVARQSGGVEEEVENLLPRLRDPAFTRVLVCTLPEATPVHEAAGLQADLERAGIHPSGWVVNQTLTSLEVTDPVLRSRQAREGRYLQEVATEHAKGQPVTRIAWSERPLTE